MSNLILELQDLKKEIEDNGMIATADEMIALAKQREEIEVESNRQIMEDKVYE